MPDPLAIFMDHVRCHGIVSGIYHQDPPRIREEVDPNLCVVDQDSIKSQVSHIEIDSSW